jgi:hypothetical protein
MTLSETFLISLVATSSATFLVCLRWLYKSKCSNIKCGCIEIQRDVRGEEQLDMLNPSESSKDLQDSPTNKTQQMIRL